MEYRNQILLFVIVAYAGNLASATFFSGWGDNSQRYAVRATPGNVRRGTGTAKQWGRRRAQPIVLPCDGSPEIEKACDTFCQSIGAHGACLPNVQTCGCSRITSSAPVPQVPANSGPAPVSPQAPPNNGVGIHVLSSPDLSQTNSSPPANDGLSSEATPDVTPKVSSRHLRSRRAVGLDKIVDSSPKDTTHVCTKESCTLICKKQGYETCSAECVGLSCYCRCPSLDKAASAVPDPLTAVQEQTPEDVGMSAAFRPPS